MEKSFDKNGFHAVLPNGLTVSVQWHWGAKCTFNRDGTPETVEISCWLTDNGEWMANKVWTCDGDVIDHVPVGDVVKFIDIALDWEN